MIGPFQEESALLVPVPDTEPVVAEWRDRINASAPIGVPAPITVLFQRLSLASPGSVAC
jgi:hypothetical protein